VPDFLCRPITYARSEIATERAHTSATPLLRTRTEPATVRLRRCRIETNVKATATPSRPPCYLQPQERSGLAGMAPYGDTGRLASSVGQLS